ncbi:MAG TPA: M23 family metallopeptidase [Novosphingobium sp.]|nr:M23 family metallopeptidase [Novosphingobium sp.]
MRSQGQVRFVKITSRLQARGALVVVALLVAWLATMASMTLSQISAARDRSDLLAREAKVASAESRVAQYRAGVDSVASDLARRQQFIEKMVTAHLGELPDDVRKGETVSRSTEEAARTVDKVSAAVPEATGLARLEARQLAFVEGLTRYADRRARTAAAAIRKFGLNPMTMLASSSREAMGGPFLGLSTSRDGSLDPRFRRLGASLARMDALENSLAGIPQVRPANVGHMSSGFGYRSDPFNGRGAFHAGLDFAAPYGAPIYAAASGRVSFAGIKQGYGNCIEVDHGNGLVTRYAHMSRFVAAIGRQVDAGDMIGAIGSTGRSTGPHLHFEVHINGRPVNPRPFLEAASHVRQKPEVGG